MGKVRPPYADAAGEYERRIAERVGLRVDEVAAEPLQRGEERSRRVESERIGKRLLPDAWVVALAVDGRVPKSSEVFARWLEARLAIPKPTTFVIGGAAGLDPQLVGNADEVLALGPLTMAHQLARVVLVEQIYRATTILDGHPYHH